MWTEQGAGASPSFKTAYCPPGWLHSRMAEVVMFPSGQVDPREEPYRSMILVAPDHIESGTGRLMARETAGDQGAISGKYLFEPGDTLYSKIRPYLRKATLADFSGLTSADMYPLRPAAGVVPQYLLGLILSEHFSRFAEIVSMRSGFPKINREEFSEYTASLPPPEEQVQISAILDTIDKTIRKTEQLIAKLKQVKQGLLHDLLTRGIDDNGELRDPERHPEQFKDSALGRIPREWENGRLEEWLSESPRNGYSPQPVDMWTGKVMLGLGCLTPDGFEPRQLKNAPAGDHAIERALLADGDLLLSRSNTRDLVGLAGMYRDVGVPCVYPDLMMRLRCRVGVLGEFLELLLRSPRVRRQIQASASGTSGSMVKISSRIVRELRVAVPSPSEQKSLLRVLDRSKSCLDAERNTLSKLRLVKSGLMEDLLTGRVRVTSLLEGASA